MATITTDEQFALACNHLIAASLLSVQGERFIDRAARKVIDERIGGNVDITPDTPTLESALDAAIVTLTTEQANRATDTRERATLLDLAAAALTQIDNDKTAIANGKTAAQAATTLAQMRTILLGMLDIQGHTVNRQESEIKALRALIRSG